MLHMLQPVPLLIPTSQPLPATPCNMNATWGNRFVELALKQSSKTLAQALQAGAVALKTSSLRFVVSTKGTRSRWC